MALHVGDLGAVAELWPQLAGIVPRLINHSENHTFAYDTGEARFTLRVHRPDYQSVGAIESELAWLEAVRRDTELPVPEPVPARNGRLLQAFSLPDGQTRYGVLFRFIDGEEPSPQTNLVDLFGVLGQYAAILHRHAIGWARPPGFERQAWTAATILDADGLWGDWRMAPGVTKPVRTVLDRLDAALWRRLGDYGQGPDRYGLIHADMRLGNLLVDGNKVSLIDFDDCGFCWFAYDFAAAISFHETHKAVPALKASWLDSYRAIRPLHAEDEAAIDALVMLRRMALLAWIGSHAETSLAQTHMHGFAEGTADLAERFLRGSLWS